MNHDAISTVLSDTLEDHRLSRGERSALTDLIERELHDPSDRAFLRNEAFRLTEAAVTEDPRAAGPVLEWLRGIMKALTNTEAPVISATVDFSPGEECRSRIRSLLRAARRTIDIAVFTITDDSITGEIVAAHARGVAVRVVTDDDKAHDLGSDAARLEEAGIPIAYDDTGHMHHKFAVFDGHVVLNGSYNWTRAAARENHENVVVTDNAAVAAGFNEEFESLWNRYAR